MIDNNNDNKIVIDEIMYRGTMTHITLTKLNIMIAKLYEKLEKVDPQLAHKLYEYTEEINKEHETQIEEGRKTNWKKKDFDNIFNISNKKEG